MKLQLILALGCGLCFPMAGCCGDFSACEAQLQNVVSRFQTSASRLAGEQLEIRVIVTHRVPDGLDAYADSRESRVVVAPRVCRYGEMSRIMLIAHEIGHLVGHARLPELRRDASSGSPRIGLAVHEGVADNYAAKMLRQIPSLDFAIDAMRSLCAADTEAAGGFDSHRGASACAHLGAFIAVDESRAVAP